MNKIIIGKKSVINALTSEIKLKQIFLCKSKQNHEIIALAKNHNCQFIFWNEKQFEKYFKDEKVNHQFCIAFVQEPNNLTVDELVAQGKKRLNPIIVILDEINDPQNFGAIIRTCAAADVLGIIHKKHNQAPQNNLAVKASMGTNAFLPIIPVTNLVNTINFLKKNDYWILVTSTSSNAIPYWKIPKQRSYALVVGNEANGVSNLIKKNADYLITIPIKGKVQSLNVNAATGIILFDLTKGTE